PGDMKYFKEKTTGNVVVMGLATLLSFPEGKPLKDRTNIVLCDDPDFKCDGATTVGSIDELLEEIKKYDTDSVYIVGGASVYAQMLPYCDTAYITKVDASSDAEKFFPNLDENEDWILSSESEPAEYNGLVYKFTEYKNINA
ncbi:MAG: dihydrofolate reductase, partial [Clostridia bacterium]|nr:dihydrofolate reductase [Clostridia bacterium]